MGPADVIVENIIAQEIGFTLRQSQYFQARAKVGAVVVPAVYQPVIEPAEGRLIAIFVEPGAAHLVFQDEIAPVAKLDSRYREIRRGVFGRTHDVESVEFIDGQISFPDASSGPFNLYETSFHFKTSEAYQAAIYSNTWNHLMSAGPQWYIALSRDFPYQLVTEANPALVVAGDEDKPSSPSCQAPFGTPVNPPGASIRYAITPSPLF